MDSILRKGVITSSANFTSYLVTEADGTAIPEPTQPPQIWLDELALYAWILCVVGAVLFVGAICTCAWWRRNGFKCTCCASTKKPLTDVMAHEQPTAPAETFVVDAVSPSSAGAPVSRMNLRPVRTAPRSPRSPKSPRSPSGRKAGITSPINGNNPLSPSASAISYMAVGSPVAALPPGWTLEQTDDGNPYYFNAKTGESSWGPPTA